MNKIILDCKTFSADEFRRSVELAKECGMTHVIISQIEKSIWQWNRDRRDPYPNWGMGQTSIFKIVQGIIQAITESVGLGIAQETVVPQEIIDAVSNTGFLESIPLWAVTLLGSIFITILSFVMILTVYGRFFKLYMYTAISPIPLAAAAGESTQSTAFTFIKSYTGVCLEGAIIVLSCIIFSAFASSPPVVDTSASAVTMIWSYIGELIFNMLVLVGTTKMSDRIVKGMIGLQFCGYIVATFVDIL